MPRLLVLVWYGEACLQLGEIARSAAAYREVASWSERAGATTGEAWSLGGLARIALTEGDLDGAERLAVRAHSLCHPLRQPSINMVVSATLARVRLAQGNIESAKGPAEEATDDCRRIGAVVYHAQMLELLAEIHQAAGDDEAAAARAEVAALRPAVEPA